MSIKWILRITCLMQIASIGILWSFEAVRMKDMGIGETAIGIILGVSSGIFILSSLVWGRVADKFLWHRKIAIWGSLLFGLLLLYFSICSTVWDFAIYGTLKAVAAPMIFGMMPALAVESFGRERQGRDFGVYRAFGSLGFILGAMVLPLIFNEIGNVARAASLFIFVSCLLLVQLPEPEAKSSSAARVDPRFLNVGIKLFLFSYFFIALSEPAIGGFYSAYVRHLGGTTRLLGLFFGLMGFMALVFLPLVGKWLDRANPTFVLSIAFLAQPIRVFLTSVIGEPEMLWIPLLLHGLCWGGIEVAAIIYLTRLAGAGNKATVLSYYMATRMLGNFLGAAIAGYLAEHLGYVFMFRVMSMIALAGVVFYVAGAYRPKPGKAEPLHP